MSSKINLFNSGDDRGVSPVIGVILMVAITVILAAVIAAFVMDIGDLDDSAPNAQFNWEEESDGNYTVAHTSGDNIDPDDIRINGLDAGNSSDASDWPSDGSSVISAGDSVELKPNNGEVTVVWEADGSSTILTDYEA